MKQHHHTLVQDIKPGDKILIGGCIISQVLSVKQAGDYITITHVMITTPIKDQYAVNDYIPVLQQK